VLADAGYCNEMDLAKLQALGADCAILPDGSFLYKTEIPMRVFHAMLAALLIVVAIPVAAPQEPEAVDSSASGIMTPNDLLFRAIDQQDVGGVLAALGDGADPNSSDSFFGHTLRAVGFACVLGEEEGAGSAVAQVLIDAGADPNMRNEHGETILHLTRDAAVAQVLIDAGANVNARQLGRETPLHNADSAELVRVLIDAGADPNARDNFGGETPLHEASFSCWPEAAQALIAAGANVNARTDSSPDDPYWGGSTPLHYAGCTDTVWVLFDAGANPNTRNERGETPAESAARRDFMDGYEEVAQLLGRMAGR